MLFKILISAQQSVNFITILFTYFNVIKINQFNNFSLDLLADFNTIVNGWKSYFSQLLHVNKISDVRHIEIHKLSH
jgi:hypothetical protein